jgi:hypothetical protein
VSTTRRGLRAGLGCAALVAVCGAQTCAPAAGGAPLHQVRGTVVDGATGQPVALASVSIPGTQQQALSNDAGQFALCYVPAGAATLRAQAPGFAPATAQVRVPAADTSARTTLALARSGPAAASIREARPLLIGDTAALVVDGTRRASGVYDGCDLRGPNAEGWRTLQLTPDVVSSVEVYHGPAARQQFGFPHALVVTTRRFEKP